MFSLAFIQKEKYRENYWAVTRIYLPNGEKSYIIVNGMQKIIVKGRPFSSVGYLRTMIYCKMNIEIP